MVDTEHAPRVILHIGAQKNASKSMQAFLAKNREALAPFVRVFTPLRGTPSQRLGRKALDFSIDPTPETEAAFVAAIGDMRDVLSAKSGTCLISHENLIGAMPGSMGETGLYPRIARIVALLIRGLAPFRLHFAYYTRDLASWKRSVHNQAVKTDGCTGSWDAYAAETAHITGWDGFDARLRAAAGNQAVSRLRLENEADPMRPGQQLLRLAGVPDPVVARLKAIKGRRNESLNAGALEFMRRVNADGFAPHIRHRLGLLVAQSGPLFSTSLGLTRDPYGKDARDG